MKKFIKFLLILLSFIYTGNSKSWISKIRILLYRILGAKIGSNCVIHHGVRINNPHLFKMGDQSGLGAGSAVHNDVEVIVGDKVLIGPNVQIFTSNHNWNKNLKTYFAQGFSSRPIEIGSNCWLGASSILVSGSSMSEGVTLGAGSVLRTHARAYSVMIGNPAVEVKIKK